MADNMSPQSSSDIPFATSIVSRVNQTTLFVVVWTGTGITTVLCFCRLSLRLALSRTLFLDDLFALLAEIFLLAHSVDITVMARPLYRMMAIRAGVAAPTPGLDRTITLYYRLQFAENMMYWSCLWSVKAGFLVFYHRLLGRICQQVPDRFVKQRIFLWGVMGYTGLAYVGCILPVALACPSLTYLSGDCHGHASSMRVLLGLWFTAAVDISSDLLIIIFPFTIVYRARLQFAQKVWLSVMFSLGGFIIAAAIVRIVITNSNPDNPELSSLQLWSANECNVAMTVYCVLAFRRLYNDWQQRRMMKGPQCQNASTVDVPIVLSVPAPAPTINHTAGGKWHPWRWTGKGKRREAPEYEFSTILRTQQISVVFDGECGSYFSD